MTYENLMRSLPVDAEAAHSFRYRLREAAKQALTLGDTLLQMSQDASVPTDKQLEELGSIEQSLRVVNKYRVPDLKPCADNG